MANFKEDASSEISPPVIQILEQFLDVKYKQRKYKYQIQGAAKKGDNYMGVVYRVTITLLNDNKKKQSVILKVPPQNQQQRNQFFARAGFLREALTYEEDYVALRERYLYFVVLLFKIGFITVNLLNIMAIKFLPLANDFQKSKGLAENDTFFEYPQCYFTSTDEFNEAVCMNDLQTEGFFMHNRFEPLTLDQVKILMGIYAKLHGTSLAIKDQNPDKMNSFKNISDIFEQRKNDIQLNHYFESLKLNALESINNANDRAYWEKLKEYFDGETFYNLMLTLLESSSSEPYSVICHGDCWINNVMFKQENSEVVDARIIDWQIMRYSSPITDLMYFLMSSTTREFRQRHFNEILDIYYNAAKKHILRLGSDPEKVYSRSAFENQLKKKGAIGLLFSMIVLPMLTTKSEDVPDLEKLSEKVSAGQSTDAMEAGFVGAKSAFFNDRMRGIIIDSIDWNLI